jgi:hypothetical protein
MVSGEQIDEPLEDAINGAQILAGLTIRFVTSRR